MYRRRVAAPVRFLVSFCVALAAWLYVEPRLFPVVPVLVFHKTPEFEPVAAWLQRHGYRTLALPELRAVLRGELRAPPRAVVLTFDDGDATHAFSAAPALARHGLTGVFFVVAGRPGEGPARGTSPDSLPAEARGDADLFAATHPGAPVPYSLDWGEARRIEWLGAGEIASHTATHDFEFASDSLTGFAAEPNWKTVCALGGDARPGGPVFAGRPALLGPAFKPSAALVESLRAVPRSGALRARLASAREVVRRLGREGRAGCTESGPEYRERLAAELGGARGLLERHLGHPVTALAWPWGASTPDLVRQARLAGYTLVFTTEPFAARRGCDTLAVPRIVARPDTAWLEALLRIYTRRSLGQVYGRLHPAKYPD